MLAVDLRCHDFIPCDTLKCGGKEGVQGPMQAAGVLHETMPRSRSAPSMQHRTITSVIWIQKGRHRRPKPDDGGMTAYRIGVLHAGVA